MPGDITVKELEPLEALSVRDVLVGVDDIGGLIKDALSGVFHAGLQLVAGPIAVYHQLKPEHLDVEVVCPVGPYEGPQLETPEGRKLEHRSLGGGPVAVLVFVGPYDEIPGAYGELTHWIGTHGYRYAGPPQEVYMSGPDEPGPPVTEIRIPIADE